MRLKKTCGVALVPRPLVLAAWLAAACFVPAQAALAAAGASTGLIVIPTADILQEGELRLGALGGGVVEAHAGYGFGHDVEAGLISRLPQEPDEPLQGYVKGRLYPESRSDPALAVGFERGDVYFVVSKALTPRFRGHLGYGSGRLGFFGGVTFSSNTVAAVSRNGVVPPQLTWMLDFTSEGMNAGVRMAFLSGWRVELAALQLRSPVIGVSYRLSL